MIVTNPFLIDTLCNFVYTTFFYPWVIYSSLHFDVQFSFFLQLRHVDKYNHFLLLLSFPKIFLSSYLYISLFTEFHEIVPNEKWQRISSFFPIRLPGAPFPGCLLPFCVPVKEPSYLDLMPASSPISPSLPPCSCPLPYSSSLSLTLRYFQFSQ